MSLLTTHIRPHQHSKSGKPSEGISPFCRAFVPFAFYCVPLPTTARIHRSDETDIIVRLLQRQYGNLGGAIHEFRSPPLHRHLHFPLIVAASLWLYRIWSVSGLLRDFTILSTEARAFNVETISVRRYVEQWDAAEWLIKFANLEALAVADECDARIGIALSAWNGIMQPHESQAGRGTDLQVGKVDKTEQKEKERGTVHLSDSSENNACRKFREGRSSVRTCGKCKEKSLPGTTLPFVA